MMYEVRQVLKPNWSSYTDTDKSVVMLTLNSRDLRREAITTVYKVLSLFNLRHFLPALG